MIRQAACVPYRQTESGYEILLVTTRKGKWTLPKGIIDPGETAQETAAKEAFEEAGIRGAVESGEIGAFRYHKWDDELVAAVYLMRVDEELDTFEDASFRKREWMCAEEAIDRIRARMRRVVRKAVAILDERFG